LAAYAGDIEVQPRSPKGVEGAGHCLIWLLCQPVFRNVRESL